MIDMIGARRRTDDALHHPSVIFPSNTSLTCTFTAAATAHTFGEWAAIVDSGATGLSALFATEDGHISAILIETVSENDTIYEFEIAWGAGKVPIGEFRFAGETKFQAPNTTNRFWAHHVPKGQTVYYRMKSATAVADTCTLHLRVHTH